MTIKDFCKQNSLRFFFLVIIQIIVSSLMIVLTHFSMNLTNAVQERNWHKFLLFGILNISFVFVDYFLQGYSGYLQRKQEEAYMAELRSKFTKHFYSDKKNHPVAQVQNRLTNDLTQLRDDYLTSFFDLIDGITILVSVIILLMNLHWLLLATIVLMVTVSLALPKLLEKPMQKATTQISLSNKQYLDTLNKWLSGLGEIRRYLSGEKLLEVVGLAGKKLENANVKQVSAVQSLSGINELVSAVFQTLQLLLAGYLIYHNEVMYGAIIAIGNCDYYLSFAIEIIVNSYGKIKAIKPLNAEIAESSSLVRESETEVKAPSAISTRDLSLNFLNGESLFFPNIEVHPGEKILLTGDSGTGKTTLFKIILGQIKPNTGEVIFKDKNGKVVNPDMSRVGYIPQEPVLFPVSIADNMTMFRDKLRSALPGLVEKVQFAADVAKFSQGLDEQIDLNKLNISGGQRQKIVLVRALVHQSEIILIDEGTSAIDQKATMEILHQVTATPATVIFIAHSFNDQMKQLFDREIHLEKKTKQKG